MSASTGRGGAGNIGPEEIAKKDKVTAESLVTPTIKENTYTTGRGGSGNMAKQNPNKPAESRVAQDVEGPTKNAEPRGTVHHGRGGEGNVIRESSRDNADRDNNERKPRASSGLLEKAKEGLERFKRSASGTREETQEGPK